MGLHSRYDRLAGTLLGTALGDGLGLPAEGMAARAITRRFGTMDRFRLLGSIGFVSDDTEQTALVAGALIAAPGDRDRAVASFRHQLLLWFTRLPWGVGRATVRACGRIAVGMRRSGVPSAGNGAAMRSAIIGVFLHDQPSQRRDWAEAFALVTHTDRRAVEGAVFVAEVAALAASAADAVDRFAVIEQSQRIVTNPQLAEAIACTVKLAQAEAMTSEAAQECGTTGFVVATVAFATFLWLRWGADPLPAWVEGIAAGGDTDTVAAILGGWMGAALGESSLPTALIARLHDGPFGPTHLRQLAAGLVEASDGVGRPPPHFSSLAALGRNIFLIPVILGHGFRRLIPF